jgi:transcription antitermination factor NusG
MHLKAPANQDHGPPVRDGDGEGDEFVFPPDLFEAAPNGSPAFWTCVRARPRWEKKLCRTLRSQAIAHYMPVAHRTSYSGRKLRTASIPLFPGFVFVPGDQPKGAFKDAGILGVLKPSCAMRVDELDGQIRAVRRMLALGTPVGLTTRYEAGDRVTIGSGPLRGLSGTVTSTSNARRLVLWIDMLGVGACVQLTCDTVLARAA